MMMTTSILREHTTTTAYEDDVQNQPKVKLCGKQGRYRIAILTKKEGCGVLTFLWLWSPNFPYMLEWMCYPVKVDWSTFLGL